MSPSQYIDRLQECGVVMIAMLKRGDPVGICQSFGADEHSEQVQAIMAAWIADNGDNHALAAALVRRGLTMEIET